MAPFRVEELGVRIARARSRRIITKDLITLGSLGMDLAAYEVRLDGEPLDFTHMEYRLLELLASHSQRRSTRASGCSAAGAWGNDHAARGRTVDGHVGRLRRS